MLLVSVGLPYLSIAESRSVTPVAFDHVKLGVASRWGVRVWPERASVVLLKL